MRINPIAMQKYAADDIVVGLDLSPVVDGGTITNVTVSGSTIATGTSYNGNIASVRLTGGSHGERHVIQVQVTITRGVSQQNMVIPLVVSIISAQ